MAKLSIVPMQTVEIDGPKPAMTYLMNFDQRVKFAGYFWFIEGAAKKIIVDTGGGPDWLISHGFPAKQVATPEELLQRVGLKCEDIDLVIVTHMMGDHLEYAGKYKNAKFIVQAAELDWALNTPPVQAGLYPKDFFQDLKVVTVSGDTEIVDGVRVMLTPGHSGGGQSVAVETDEGVAVITGFCCLQENLQPPPEVKEHMPMVVPGIHINTVDLWNSMLRVMQCADIPVALHDAQWGQMQRIPKR